MDKQDKQLIKAKIEELEGQLSRSINWKRECELEIEALKLLLKEVV